MKKTYNSPITQVYVVSPVHIVSASEERGFAVDSDYDYTDINEDASDDNTTYNVWKQEDDDYIDID